MFPPQNAEEGLSSQFQQVDRNNNGFGNQFGGPIDDDDKKGAKKPKKANAGKNANTNGNAGKEVPNTSSK